MSEYPDENFVPKVPSKAVAKKATKAPLNKANV